MSTLFRKEILRSRSPSLFGDVLILVPLSWQIIGYLIFFVLVVSVIFLSLASYARVELATGSVEPDRGVAHIMPTRRGVISQLMVREGDVVLRGSELLVVRTEEDSASGPSTAMQVRWCRKFGQGVKLVPT